MTEQEKGVCKDGVVVQLNGGGPLLVVVNISLENLQATVRWFDAQLHVQEATFKACCLRLWSPEPAPVPEATVAEPPKVTKWAKK